MQKGLQRVGCNGGGLQTEAPIDACRIRRSQHSAACVVVIRSGPSARGVTGWFSPCVQAGFLLSELLTEHPGMKLVVVREVERFMFRPGLQERARYYAVIFLNQLVLSHQESHGAPSTLSHAHAPRDPLFQCVCEDHGGAPDRCSEAGWATHAPALHCMPEALLCRLGP